MASPKEVNVTTRSKGVTAFAIYFIVFSAIIFIKSLGTLIFYLLRPTESPDNNLELFTTSYAAPSVLEWLIHSLSVAATVVLFFTALYILRNKKSSIKLLSVSAISLIFINILQIINSWMDIRASAESALQVYTTYRSALGISFNVFAILFWVFVIWFFSRKSVKAQLTA